MAAPAEIDDAIGAGYEQRLAEGRERSKAVSWPRCWRFGIGIDAEAIAAHRMFD